MDGNTDYRTFCLYLFVRRGIPISMSVYNFVGDVVKSETLQKYFEGRDLTFSEKRMEDCADYIMAHYNEWLKNSEEWYESIPAHIRPKRNQPFYHLLAESNDVTYEAYVSEQNLLLDNSKEPVKHPLIEEIFSGKKGSSYFKISN